MAFDDFCLDMYLKELETVVNIDSGSGTPFGVAKVAAIFAEKFRQIGCRVETVQLSPDIGPCIKIRNKESDRFDALLVGHMDTVFPVGTAGERPFTVKDRKATGPGASDMKAGILSAYYIVKELLKQKDRDLSLCVFLNSDEEIGSIHSTPLIKECGGKSKAAFIFEAGRMDGSFVVQRKGTAKYEMVFKGVSAHSGADPEKGRSAVTEMAHWIVALDQLNDYENGLTLNTGIAKGGTVTNMVASHAEMRLDTRFNDRRHYDLIRDRIGYMKENLFINGVTVDVRQISFREPMNPHDKTFALMGRLEEIGEKQGVPVTWKSSGGVSDGNGISTLGIPVIDGCGPTGGHAHNENEYFEVDSVLPRMKMIYEMILTI